jgi:hypothetical protein
LLSTLIELLARAACAQPCAKAKGEDEYRSDQVGGDNEVVCIHEARLSASMGCDQKKHHTIDK